MIATLIAVFGTLAGTVVAGFMQNLTTARTTREAAAERRREALACDPGATGRDRAPP
ncbi:hypothetical protein [Streptomyces sp. NPDC088794]|uniref:hypothetical protein n=1 Tax=Streptomyces sp. NPDC088794 TaxID=3365902 RepID=UPI003824F5D6